MEFGAVDQTSAKLCTPSAYKPLIMQTSLTCVIEAVLDSGLHS